MMKKAMCFLAMLLVVALAAFACNDVDNGNEFEMSNLVLTPDQIIAGDEITVTVTVTNSGDQEGTHTVELKVNNVVVGQESITLAASGAGDVTFTAVIDEVGEHLVEVNALSGTIVALSEELELGDTYKFTMNLSSPEGTGTLSYWQKGANLRIEADLDFDEGPGALVLIFREGFAYLYFPDENMAMEYPIHAEPTGLTQQTDMFAELYVTSRTDEGALAELRAFCAAEADCVSVDLVGHETVNGVSCAVFEIELIEDRGAELWLDVSRGFPVKMEIEEEGFIFSMEWSDVDLAPVIPDSMFELPEGVEIMGMP